MFITYIETDLKEKYLLQKRGFIGFITEDTTGSIAKRLKKKSITIEKEKASGKKNILRKYLEFLEYNNLL